MRLCARRLAMLSMGLVGFGVLGAGSAAAHPVLIATNPAPDSVVEEFPQAVELRFTEPVSASLGGVRVLDSTGTRTDQPLAAGDDPSLVSVPISSADQRQGTYFVAWRVTSVDGHTLHGTFAYSVGAPEALDEELVAQFLSGQDDRALGWVAGALRWLLYAASFMAAGGTIFLLYVHGARTTEWLTLRRVVTRSAGIAAATTVVAIAVQAALVTGRGAGAVLDPSVARAVLTSPYGRSAALRVVALIVLVLAVRRTRATLALQLAAVSGVVALASFALDGHSATSQPRWLSMGADVVHLAAAATWFGGLVLLFVALRHRGPLDDAVGAARMVSRFAAAAGDSLLALTVAGLSLAWLEVRTPQALVSSRYGWTLIAKAVLVALVVAIAAYNRRRLVPRIEGAADDADAQSGSADEKGTPEAWTALRRTLRIEAVALLGVLALTAVLVNLLPARQSAPTAGDSMATAE